MDHPKGSDIIQPSFLELFESAPGLYVILKPEDFQIVAVSDSYLEATFTERENIVGKALFEVFPGAPDKPWAEGVRNLRDSLELVKKRRRCDVMAVQQYPIRRPAGLGGGFEERWWSPVNSPVCGPAGDLEFIIHRVEDVTPFVLEMRAEGKEVEALHLIERGAQHMQAEVVLRAQDLQRINERLREKEQRLQATFENAASGILETDRADRLVAVNDRLCQMLGYSRQELLGRSVDELTYIEDRPRTDELYAQLREGRVATFAHDKRCVKCDGSPLWVHVAVSAVRDEAGRHVYSVGTVVDISARKSAEDQARLQVAALDAAPNSISVSKTDPQGKIVWVNEAFTKLTGYSAHEAIGQNHYILNSGRQSKAFYQELWETIRRGQEWRGELINRRKDGTLYHEEMGITPLRNEQGNVTHYVAIKQDITARKQVEEALRASEERYRLLMDSIRDHAVVLVDVEGRIRSWNPGAERVFGWKREEIVGLPIDVLFTPEDRAMGIPAQELEQASRLGRAGADRWQVRKDGTRFYAAGSVAPVRSGNETMPSYVMVLSDATQEKLAERVLQESEQVLRKQAAPPTRSVLSRYGLPVVLSMAAALLWHSIPVFGPHSPPYILASLAVAFAAWWGGVGPGLVTTAGCALVAWLEFIAPAPLTAEIARWAFFICNGTILSALAGGMRQAIGRQQRTLSQLAAEIQERRRMEAAMREQAQMLDLSYDAVFAWQLRGAIRNWNSGAERLYGYSRAEAMGQVPQELLGTRTDDVASFQTALEQDGYWAGELRQVTRDGLEVVVESRMVLLPQEADGPGVVIESARDITQRKWTEAALRSSEEQFRAFFENAAVGAVQTDGQNRLLQVNDYYCRITGYSREELVGMSPLLLDHPDDREADIEKARRFFLGQVPAYDAEKRYVRKDGRVIWVHVTAALIRGAGDRPTRTAAIVEDITQRKKIEEQLKHLTVTLEAEVQRRTAELQRRASQLQALAGRLAQAEEQERRRLAHLLHDGLQQLLVAAKMRLSWLGSSTGEESLRTTVREAEDLLDQSIDQSRSLTAELSPPVLYEQGLEAGLKWLSQWMQNKHGFTVHVGVDAGQFEDLSAEVRMFLFQAVRELLFNAVKHAGVKQACVGIRMAEPDLVRVAVADEGVGFDPAALTQSQAESGASGGTTTSGSFGLFSVRERLELLGGRMDVQSAPGQGTQITLEVPLRRVQSTESEPLAVGP